MKLAEALAQRADCQKMLDVIKSRLEGLVRVQEGEQPVEDPAELLAEADRNHVRLLELITAINRTNAQTSFDTERTLSDVLAEREAMSQQRGFLADVADVAASRWERFSKSEVRYVISVPVAKLRAQADQFAKRHRELDLRIQELNWKTELI